MPTVDELRMLQALPLEIKIAKTKLRIREWVNHFGAENCYVSFSGGKDSTVLLDIVRQEYPQIEAVFVDTGLEYPEIKQFVKGYDNVVKLRPEMNFRQVILDEGYPIISKEISHKIYYRQKGSECMAKYFDKNYQSQYKVAEKWWFLAEQDAPFKVCDKCCNVMKKKPAHTYERKKWQIWHIRYNYRRKQIKDSKMDTKRM